MKQRTQLRIRPAGPILPTSVERILERYPQRQEAWGYDRESNSFSIEASTLSAIDGKDPWNRPLSKTHPMAEFRDNEQEITHWKTMTTVAGERVDLTIFND